MKTTLVRRLFPLVANLALSLATLTAAERGRLTVTWFDLKSHGLAVVMETPSGQVFLIDTGGFDPKQDYVAARDTVAPYVKSKGYKEIAGIAVSHPHRDHYGGVEWWLKNFPVKQFVDTGLEGRAQTDDYRKLRALAKERGAEYRTVHAGTSLNWDKDLDIEVLSPPKEFLELGSDPKIISDHRLGNENSLVLRVQHGENVFLFPADAEVIGQRFLLTNIPPLKLRANVVTAPAHGWISSPEFVQATRPKVVIASCLALYPANPNPKPSDLAVKAYTSVGARTLVTAWHGNVTVESNGKSIIVKTEREAQGLPKSQP